MQGLPASSATHQFASDLIARIPRGGASGPSVHKVQATQAAAFVRNNAKYSLLVDDEDDEDVPVASTSAPAKPSKDKKIRKKKVRGCASFDWRWGHAWLNLKAWFLCQGLSIFLVLHCQSRGSYIVG